MKAPIASPLRRGAGLKRAAAAFFAAFVVASVAAVADPKPDIKALKPGPVAVRAERIASFGPAVSAGGTYGELEWRGGLVLSSPSVNFGGWSGLVVDPDGRNFFTVSDSGAWLSGAFTYSGRMLTGVRDTRLGPLTGENGRPLQRARDRDAESLALSSGSTANGSFLVGFEGSPRIVRYEFANGALSAGRPAKLSSPDFKSMKRNSGLEAMTVLRGGPYKGSPVAIAERMLDADQNHTGFIWLAGRAERFHLTNTGGFDVTDVAGLDDGGMIVLERRFGWLEGVKLRLRRIAADALAPRAVVDGAVLLEADMTSEIDNMEGLAVSRGPAGETVLTLISDNNFRSFLQRTIVLQFAFLPDQTAKARPVLSPPGLIR